MLFPPQTREIQFDEKWSFVGKKESHCSPDEPLDSFCGDDWDHTAIDPESRLLLSVIPGKRTTENCEKIVEDVKNRTGGRMDLLITSDAYLPYTTAIEKVYGQKIVEVEEPDSVQSCKSENKREMPKDLCYATVQKIRENGRVVEIVKKIVFGTVELLKRFLERSTVSISINTSFIERNNGTDRKQNARKVRKTYCFSKDWEVHNAATYFCYFSYNFCWPVRTLRIKDMEGKWQLRTPAMVAGLTDNIWSVKEWITYPSKGG